MLTTCVNKFNEDTTHRVSGIFRACIRLFPGTELNLSDVRDVLKEDIDLLSLARRDAAEGIHMFEFLSRDRWRAWAPIPIRLILGVGFMVHGWAKWNRGPAAFADQLQQARVPFPLAGAWLVTLLEIFGGLALITGAFVALVSIPLIFSMLGAMFTVNIKYGFSAVNTIGLTPEGPQLGPPGYEINLLYIAGLVALILGGAGPLSIDALRSRHRQRQLGLAA